MVEEFSVLKFILFSELEKWNVEEILNGHISGRYASQSLANFLVRNKEPVEIKNDILYKQITIHQFGEGVSLRCEKYGRDIKTNKIFQHIMIYG